MAAPNVVNVATITAKSNAIALSTTGATQLVSNAASSGKVFKVNMIQVSNVDGTNNCHVSVDYHNQDDIGGTGFALASTVTVPADASVVILDKNTAIYLEEDRSISVTAETANDLEVLISYEEIS